MRKLQTKTTRTQSTFLPILLTAMIGLFIASCKKDIPVLVVLGGHSFDTTEFFDLFTSLENVEYEVVWHPEALELLDTEQRKNFEVVVFYDFMKNLSPAKAGVFQKLTAEGTPLFFMHHALGNFQLWEGYQKLVGGSYVGPLSGADSAQWSDYRHDIDLEIEIVNPEHPVTMGMEDFSIHDEGYMNTKVMPDVTPLLRTIHQYCDPLTAWTHEYENSTVIYLMLGHDRLAYSNPAFKQFLENGIHWLAVQ